MRTILELSVTPFSFERCFVDSSGRAAATCINTAPYILMERCLICRREIFAFTSICLSTHDSSVVIMTKLRVGQPGNRRSIVGRDRGFVFFAVSRLVQGPAQPALKWVLRVSFSGNKGVRACVWPLVHGLEKTHHAWCVFSKPCTKLTLHCNQSSGHLKTEHTESLFLLRRHLGNWPRGPALSMRSELLVAHEKLGQLSLLTVYVVPV